MNKTIHIREAVTPEEVERFWQELHAYHARDIFPAPAEEDRAYFLDDSQYRAAVQRIHDRDGDRCYYLLFRREGREYWLHWSLLSLRTYFVANASCCKIVRKFHIDIYASIFGGRYLG